MSMSTVASIVIDRSRLAWVRYGLLVVLCVFAPTARANRLEPPPLPDGAMIEIVGRGSMPSLEWGDVLVSLLDPTVLAIGPGWDEGHRLGRSLVEADTDWVHLASRTPGDWLHGRRWGDPELLAERLRDEGARPLGGGRFELESGRVVATLAEGWLLMRPANSRWRPSLRELLGSFDRPPIDPNDAPTMVSARIRHDAPVDGVTRLTIRPLGERTAEVVMSGRYAASPIGEGRATLLDPAMLSALEDRFGAVVLESGVGLVDPRLVDAAIEIPDLMPPASVRRHLQPRRLLVLDTVESVAGIDAPVLGVAVPLDGLEGRRSTVVGDVDAWLDGLARTLRRRWDSDSVAAGDESSQGPVRHRSLGPGFLEAMDRHPVAFAASLNWAVLSSEEAADSSWLILGTTPDVVEGLVATLGDAPSDRTPRSLALTGVSRPWALQSQARSFAEVRRWSPDERSEADAALLEGLADALGSLERVEWAVTLRTPTEVELTIQVERRAEPPTGERTP